MIWEKNIADKCMQLAVVASECAYLSLLIHYYVFLLLYNYIYPLNN